MRAFARTTATATALVILAASGCGNGANKASATSTSASATTSAGSSTTAASASDSAETTAKPASSTGCDSQPKKTTVAYATIADVPADALSLDIYNVPGVCDAPVWMWVHGGGYQIGDKSKQVADKVTLARKHGWVFVSINYRLSSGAAGSQKPGDAQYPDHFSDVAAAVAWVHDHIATYGGDPARLALFGHSAGADIVSNVAINPAYLAEHDLKLSDLACAGPLDTAGFDKAKARPAEQDNWEVALGNSSTYTKDTSATLLAKPGIGIPPMIGVVRGAAGRQAIERDFLAAVRAAGAKTTEIDARGLSHGQVNSNIGALADRVMTKPVTKFLTACLGES